MPRMAMDQPADSIYKKQLSRGFKGLRFEEPLERDFRLRYISKNLPAVRIALSVALALVGVLSFLDWRLLPADFWRQSVAIRLGLIAPALAITLGFSYAKSLARYVPSFLIATGLVIGLATLWIGTLASHQQLEGSFANLVVASIFIYLLFGLRFPQALLVAVSLFLAYLGIAAFSGQSPEVFIYQAVFLSFANIVGAVGCYRLEHSSRTIFLETEIMNLLVGSDTLTGIPNRRMFNRHLHSVWRQSQRESCGMAVALIDLDYFQEFNDQYGREAGDTCLRRIAHTIMRAARRPLDFTGRFGGAEFVVVLFDPNRQYLQKLAARIRDQIALLDIPNGGSKISSRVTASIGIALAAPGCRESADALLRLADDALLEAKETGRDRYVIKEPRPNASSSGVFPGPWLVQG